MTNCNDRVATTHGMHAPVWFAARASAFAALCAFGMQPLAASAQATLPIKAAAGAPTTIGNSAAGVPIVNIAAPNARGVSNNRFDQFNVGTAGVVVNNSAQTVQTQLAGSVQGNAALGRQGANLVLMQVTSGAPSQLLGKTEIAGQRANFVLANPAGITCSGCGFLNAPRVTLATGTPNLNADGTLAGFDVKQGRLAIDGAGLVASNSAIDLIARAMTINGNVQGQSIDAIAGANRVDYATNNAIAQTGSGDKPAVAIDVQALGSMYGNGAVRLIGTEAGVGVRDTGKLTSLTGNISIGANGDVTIGAPAQLQAGNDLSIGGANVVNHGALSAQRDVDLTASGTVSNEGSVTATAIHAQGRDAMINRGSLSAGENVRLSAGRVTLDDGTLNAAGQVVVDAQSVSNQRGTLTAGREIAIDAGRVDNTGGTLSAGTDAVIRSADGFVNANGTLAANGDVSFNGGMLDNANGEVTTTRGTINVAAGAVSNAAGRIQAADALYLQAGTIDNTDGALSAGTGVALQAANELTNVRGSIDAGSALLISSASLDNRTGTITAAGDASFNVTGAMSNDAGSITSESGITAYVGSISSENGTMTAPYGVTLATRGGGYPQPVPYHPVEPEVTPVPEVPSRPQNDGVAYDERGQKYYEPAKYEEQRVQGATVQSYSYSERDAQRALLMNDGKPAPAQFGVTADTVLKGA